MKCSKFTCTLTEKHSEPKLARFSSANCSLQIPGNDFLMQSRHVNHVVWLNDFCTSACVIQHTTIFSAILWKKTLVFVMPRLNYEERALVLAMLECGRTQEQVARSFNISRLTILRLIWLVRDTGTFIDRSRSGGPRVTSRGQDNYIYNVIYVTGLWQRNLHHVWL